MNHPQVDLAAMARQEMMDRGFEPDIPAAAMEQAEGARQKAEPGLPDLTGLLWSSLDNDDSRDLDQIEWAERAAGGDRVAVVVEMTVAADGSIAANRIYRALVRNVAQLTYSAVGQWLEGTAAMPAKVAASAELQAQLQLQNEAAHLLRAARDRMGALTFDRAELQTVVDNGKVRSVEGRRANTASRLIEDFMIGANEVMAETLRAAGPASIRRIVKVPERWPRMVELAGHYGDHLPAEADPAELNAFLLRRKQADPVHFAD